MSWKQFERVRSIYETLPEFAWNSDENKCDLNSGFTLSEIRFETDKFGIRNVALFLVILLNFDFFWAILQVAI
jgi:hypothetical protein